jgi:hypothetical protein
MRLSRQVSRATLVVLAASATLASSPVLAAPPASAAAAAPLREVCAETAYVTKRPAAIPLSTAFRGEKLRVTRYSASRRFAHVEGPRPGFTIRGWIDVANLCAKGTSALYVRTSRYSVRLVNSPAGGDPGFLYVGGPANITVKDRQRAGQPVTVCVTPAPERGACRSGHTGQTIDSIVWDQATATEVRITIEGGPVLAFTVHPYPNP